MFTASFPLIGFDIDPGSAWFRLGPVEVCIGSAIDHGHASHFGLHRSPRTLTACLGRVAVTASLRRPGHCDPC